MKNQSERDKLQLEKQRAKAVQYVLKMEREQRYLFVFSAEFEQYLNCADWLQTDAAKLQQKYYDFLCAFESLREKMREFRWNKEFLTENGIPFKEIRKLYFACTK